jgi:hypothetical protein
MRHRHDANQIRHGCSERHHHPGELAHVRPHISTRTASSAQSQYIHDQARARPTHKARTTLTSAVEKRREVPCNILSHLVCEKKGVKTGLLACEEELDKTGRAGLYGTFIGAAFSVA